MKYIFLSLLLALSVSAQDQKRPERKGPPPGERPKLTEEQKKQRAELVAKYDANKVSEDDRKLLRSFGPPPGGPKGPKHDGPPKDGDRPTKPKKN
jgi:hypothetical protein